MDAEAIELMEITSEDIDMTAKGVEWEMLFIEAGERDKFLPPRELYIFLIIIKFPHSEMFVGAGKTKYLLTILETEYKNHFKFIVIMCLTILDNNKTYLLGGVSELMDRRMGVCHFGS